MYGHFFIAQIFEALKLCPIFVGTLHNSVMLKIVSFIFLSMAKLVLRFECQIWNQNLECYLVLNCVFSYKVAEPKKCKNQCNFLYMVPLKTYIYLFTSLIIYLILLACHAKSYSLQCSKAKVGQKDFCAFLSDFGPECNHLNLKWSKIKQLHFRYKSFAFRNNWKLKY